MLQCTLPPSGWWCSREPGHDGPCAARPDLVEENPYFVEVDDNGCSKCGAGRNWVVVDPEGIRGSTSYGLEEDAQDLAEDLNRAFNAGRKMRLGTS